LVGENRSTRSNTRSAPSGRAWSSPSPPTRVLGGVPARVFDARRREKEVHVEITVSSRHVEVSTSLRSACEEKIGRLSKLVNGMDRAEVHFSEEKNPRISDKEVCEVMMEGHGHVVRAKVAAPDRFAAVDAAVEKLEHQLHKLKTKLLRRSHPR
jgi:ribosomal subunit interface protein